MAKEENEAISFYKRLTPAVIAGLNYHTGVLPDDDTECAAQLLHIAKSTLSDLPPRTIERLLSWRNTCWRRQNTLPGFRVQPFCDGLSFRLGTVTLNDFLIPWPSIENIVHMQAAGPKGTETIE